MTTVEILNRLNDLADSSKADFKKKKFAIEAANSLGVYHSDLKILAKEIGMNSALALELFDTEVYEARLLCSKIFRPKDLTIELAEKWIVTFENWEICDSFSMGVFAKSALAVNLINKWATREQEFEKRASFATMAGYTLADKKAGNEVFISFFPLMKKASIDERNFVKKAVNWALRGIGKRNSDLRDQAMDFSKELLKSDSKSAQWIAKDAIRELEKPNVAMQDHPRSIYRPAKK